MNTDKFISTITLGMKDDFNKALYADTDQVFKKYQIRIMVSITALLALTAYLVVIILSFYWDMDSTLVAVHNVLLAMFFITLLAIKNMNISDNLKAHMVGIMSSVEYMILFFLLYSKIGAIYWFTFLLFMLPVATTSISLLIKYVFASFGMTLFTYIAFFFGSSANPNTTVYIVTIVVFCLLLLMVIFVFSSFKNMIQIKNVKNEQLYKLAYRDQLTGLHNRRFTINKIDELIEIGNPFYLVYIDLDDFKTINDSLSHKIGDELLIRLGEILFNQIKHGDFLSRMGGDEFSLIINQDISKTDAKLYINRLLEFISNTVRIEQYKISVYVSCGIAEFPKDGTNHITLLKAADTAMYEAKRRGKNSYCFYNQKLSDKIIERSNLENGLQAALKNDELYLVFQPIVSTVDKNNISFEVLLRWNSKKLGNIPPSTFIPVAEELGIIHTIGIWVLEKSCEMLNDLNEVYKNAFKFRCAINISGVQLKRNSFTPNVRDIISKYKIDTSQVVFEVTESTFIEKSGASLETIETIKRDLGIAIAIDDFGTGYSSFSYLPELPHDIVKIDKSFVDKIVDSKEYADLVKGIISICHNLGKSITAEGVEKLEQLKLLTDANCDCIQGYYYSKALKKSDFFDYLNKKLGK